MLRHQFCACHRPRQPPRFCSEHALGGFRRRSERPGRGAFRREDPPPERASIRLASACSRALASGTSVAAPSPSSRRSAADDEPLDPASGPGGLDEQVQAIAVRVPAGRRGTDEGGREGLGGMASGTLGSAACGGGIGYNIHSSTIYGIWLDSAIRPDSFRPRRRIINDYQSSLLRKPCSAEFLPEATGRARVSGRGAAFAG